MADTTPGLRYASSTGRWVLAATVLGSGIAALDATVVGIALPAIGRDFHASVAGMQWVVDGYTLPLAGLLLLGGALGDLYGRRKVFVIGVVWFAVASLACGLAPNTGFLVATRALQGAGAALLTPGSLAILQASFAPDDRSKAIGAWSGLGGVATAIGPFLGGWLIGAVSWRLIFFINLPIAVAVVAIAVRHVPESLAGGAPDGRKRHSIAPPAAPSPGGTTPRWGPRQPLDIGGAVTISLALVGLTYGLIAASSDGWAAPAVLASLLAGAAMFVAFCVVETRGAHPMLPLAIFKSRQFSAANAVTFVVYGALGGALFLVPVVLQEVSGYSALEAGVAMLPLTVIMLALSARSAALSARIGPRLQMTVGPLLIGAGMALFVRVHGKGDYLTQVLPAVLVLGFGLVTNVAPLTATAMSAAPAEHSGIASAVNNDVARAASLIAVAVLPALAGITGDVYLHPAALTHGFHNAVLIAAAASVVAGLLAAATIRNPPKPAPAPEQAVPALDEDACNTFSCGLDAPPLRSKLGSPVPPGPPGALEPRELAGTGPGRHDELAQGQVPEGHRAARAGHRVEVDPRLGQFKQLEPVQEPGCRVPERTGPRVGHQELLRGVRVGRGDARRQSGGLVVGDPGGRRRAGGRGDGNRCLLLGVERPLVAERVLVRRERDLDAQFGQLRGDVRQPRVPELLVEEQQVEPVADAEPVEAAGDEGRSNHPFGRWMNVQDAAAVSMRERAHAVRRALGGQRAGGVAAAPQDHEGNQLRLADQRVRGGLSGHADELNRGRVKPGLSQGRRDHLIGQRDGRAQRGAPGPQHARIARLDELRGDVHDDVRPGFEVRSDHADWPAALGEHQAARQVADLAGGGLRRNPGEDLKLRRHRLQPGVVKPEPVADPGRQPAALRRPHVLLVGGEHRRRRV
jgi:MFS family permease